MIFPSDPIPDPIRVPKWIGWMDGLSKHLKIRLLTLDFCIVTPGLLVFTFQMLRPTCPVSVVIQNSSSSKANPRRLAAKEEVATSFGQNTKKEAAQFLW